MSIIKGIGLFAAGLITGGIGTYIWWLKKVNPATEKEISELQEYADRCRKYGDEMSEYARSMYTDLSNGDIKDFEDAYKVYSENKKKAKKVLKEDNGQNPVSEQPGKSKVYNQTKTNKVDYVQYYDATFGDDEIVDAAEKEHPTEDDTDIFLISEEQFWDDASGNAKKDLSYYDECGTVAKEEYDAITESGFIEDPISILGDALTRFGEKCDDPDEVYVRNNNLGIDFKIVRYRGTYKENVLGIYDD